MVNNQYDFIIVGQGLAGTCLSYTLSQKFGKRVLVFDQDNGRYCSSIAAGTFNPVVFRTHGLVWKAEILLPYLRTYYKELEDFIGETILTFRPVFRIFKNDIHRETWLSQSLKNPQSQFLDREIIEKMEGVKSEFGMGKVLQSGNVNLKNLVSAFRNSLLKRGDLIEQKLDFEKLEVRNGKVLYGDNSADHIIFCEGFKSTENPFFNVPLKETKGEVLIIKAPGLNRAGIVHNNINIVPQNRDLFWVGATFEWSDLTPEITVDARYKLISQIENTLSVPFEVVEQKAGIRPTVKDRRPIIGSSEKHNNVYIFNGLGTRGVMLAPYFANQLAEHILEGKPLESEVDVNRFSESE